MNILTITDTGRSAIYRLACITRDNLPEFSIKIQPFHPKKPSPAEIKAIESGLDWAHLVDVQYWKSGAAVRKHFPAKWRAKKKILTHHNPYDLHQESWDDYEKIVVLNKTQHKELPQATWIPHCINLKFFKFNKNYTNKKTVNMVAARLEGKKGISFVAQACRELGYQFLLVGRPTKPAYLQEVKSAGGKFIEFRKDISDKLLRDTYYESAVHVCNSVDNFESGTLPVLESMACGVPVLSRKVGHIPDIYNGENLRLLEGQPKDIEGIKKNLRELMEDRDLRLSMRESALKTVSCRSEKKWSQDYKKVFTSIVNSSRVKI